MRQLLHKLKSDESLMLAYQNGDSAAFEVLYMRYKDSLFAFLYRNCQHSSIVEELAQDAWVAVINHVTCYRPTAKFKTYLYQIAHNKLVDHWRKHHHAQTHNEADEKHSLGGGNCVGNDGVSGNTASDSNVNNINNSPANNNQSQVLESAHLKHQIDQALSQLPLEQRDVFLLREEGFSREAIADITGASKETVKSRLRYANNQLRILLGGIHG